MKKLLALVLAGVMVMGMSVTSMAGNASVTPDNPTYTSTEGTKRIDTYDSNDTLTQTCKGDVVIDVDPNTPGKVYQVVVEWDDLEFDYSFGSAPVWNPTNHSYSDTNSDWQGNTTKCIKITNHSNAGVDITASFAESGNAVLTKTVANVTATLNKDNIILATGEGLTYDKASNDSFEVSVTGTPNTSTDFVLGTIYLTIKGK